jgi:tRNA threonylcarbamoyl adenosine modification protein YjeE
VICLRGDVGAGKSAFARAFTRAATGDDGLDVPSPTYLVQQRYDAREGSDGGRGMRVHHYDLYRLRDASEIEAMVDLEESAESAVSVLEWSERLGRLTPETRLEVRVRAIGAGERACGEVVDDSGETASEEGDEEGDEEEEETDAAYVDVAARSFRFVGFGGDWADRIARISP